MKQFLGAAAVALSMLLVDWVSAAPNDDAVQKFPDVVDVRVQVRGANSFDFEATVSSPYDTAKRYADAFRVMSLDGVPYGERKLLHDHAGEQPFTRELNDVNIPVGVRAVIVQARDQQYGYGGKTLQVELPGR